MGFVVRAAAWTIGVLAIVVAGVLIAGMFFGGERKLTALEERRVCPPRITAAPRAAGQPVDDVVGVRAGFSVSDAEATLLCRDEDFKFQFEPGWHTPVASNVKSRQRMVADRKEERISMGIVGAEGHEVVYAVWQDIKYGETDPTPTPETMAQQLIAHYGAPHEDKDNRHKRELWWVYAPDGKAVKPPMTQGQDPFSALGGWIAGSWNFGTCAKHAKLDALSQASWSAECGVTIHAEIQKRPEDAMRVMRYRIVSIDQARLAAAVDAWRVRSGANGVTP